MQAHGVGEKDVNIHRRAGYFGAAPLFCRPSLTSVHAHASARFKASRRSFFGYQPIVVKFQDSLFGTFNKSFKIILRQLFNSASFQNMNMAGCRLKYVNLGGSRITNANLTDVPIGQATMGGMRIDDILLTDLPRIYREAVRR
jgi:uncharacterized protein YjbI with pentapeptide repeats